VKTEVCFVETFFMNMRMLEKEQESGADVEVTWEDQQAINSFSKLNHRMMNWEEKLKKRSEEKEAISDASMELELLDDDVDEDVLVGIGEGFMCLKPSKASSRLQAAVEENESECDKLQVSIDDAKSQMAQLKAKLYGKFGNAINLER
jgi:prefoldin subunit 4